MVKSISNSLAMLLPDIALKYQPGSCRPIIWFGTISCTAPELIMRSERLSMPRCIMSEPADFGSARVEEESRPKKINGFDILKGP